MQRLLSAAALIVASAASDAFQLTRDDAQRSVLRSCSNVTLFPNDNFDGMNLPNQPVATDVKSADACAEYCCSTPGCSFFTLNAGYDQPAGADCYLKSAMTHRPNAGCVSGIVNSNASALPPYLDAVKDCGADPTGVSDSISS
jgi:hypothetical protein